MQDVDMIESSGDVWIPSDTEEEYCDMSSTVIHESVEIHSTNSMDIDGERENELSHNSSKTKSTSDPGSNGSSSECDYNSGNVEKASTHSNKSVHSCECHNSVHDDVNQGNYEDTNNDGNNFNKDYESVAGEKGSEASLNGFGNKLELSLAQEYDEAAPSSEIGSESVACEQGSEVSVDGFDDELELPLASEYDEAAPEIEIVSAKNPTIVHIHAFTREESNVVSKAERNKRTNRDDTSSERERNALGEAVKSRRTGLHLDNERRKPSRFTFLNPGIKKWASMVHQIGCANLGHLPVLTVPVGSIYGTNSQ
ncbi:hypothetical protein PsorP6_012833 [Peronosclerospora sorghi]|uniref:Uncharacterized protein n=1 Tax=Peronosclerospora sorghi TaxID=230839 RepID=A0ACC0WI83_9STRA|nr:hypothetical protein PsorP6_012833 [Peronosclerospora sorghi]